MANLSSEGESQMARLQSLFSFVLLSFFRQSPEGRGGEGMATRHDLVIPQQQRRAAVPISSGKQKATAGRDGKNRKEVGDIENLVTIQGVEGKPQPQISSPVTRPTSALELGLMHYSTIMYCPSLIAASAVYAARNTLKKTPFWIETLKHHTGFSEPQLLDCAKHLVRFHSLAAESKLKVVYKKYSTPQCGAVALCPPAKKLLDEPKAAFT